MSHGDVKKIFDSKLFYFSRFSIHNCPIALSFTVQVKAHSSRRMGQEWH